MYRILMNYEISIFLINIVRIDNDLALHDSNDY